MWRRRFSTARSARSQLFEQSARLDRLTGSMPLRQGLVTSSFVCCARSLSLERPAPRGRQKGAWRRRFITARSARSRLVEQSARLGRLTGSIPLHRGRVTSSFVCCASSFSLERTASCGRQRGLSLVTGALCFIGAPRLLSPSFSGAAAISPRSSDDVPAPDD